MKTTETTQDQNGTLRGAAAIAAILQQEGVELFTCFPHNEIIDTVADLGIRPIMCRTERMAIHIADGYARLTNGKKLPAVCVQDGPGIENAFGAVAQAYGDNTPMLLLPGGYARDRQDVDPNFSATANFRNVTKWVGQANMARRIPQLMHYAFSQLRSGRRGPVMLEVLADVMEEGVAKTAVSSYPPAPSSRASGDSAAVAQLAEMWRAAKSPIIAALEARTEGWIAGLQLAALALQSQGDKANFIESFSSSHRFVRYLQLAYSLISATIPSFGIYFTIRNDEYTIS